MYTQRRTKMDIFLNLQIPLMQGDIIDIGGKKINQRGRFLPPFHQVSSWRYINNDPETNPDINCCAENIPLPDESVDGFLLCEVLEHLEHPEKVLQEAYRLLKPGGVGWITMPFLYQIHADPNDYQRWTDTKLQQVLTEIGFMQIEIKPMGGVFAVIHDLWFASLSRSPCQRRFIKSIAFRLHRLFFGVFSLLDRQFQYTEQWMSTGWGAVVYKKQETTNKQ